LEENIVFCFLTLLTTLLSTLLTLFLSFRFFAFSNHTAVEIHHMVFMERKSALLKKPLPFYSLISGDLKRV
jgi:hypothetical protein